MRNGLPAGVALAALLAMPASARIEANPSPAFDEARGVLAALQARSEASEVSISAARLGGAGWSGGSTIVSGEMATRDVPPPAGEGGSGGGSGESGSGGGLDVVIEPYDGSWGSVFAAIGLSLFAVVASPVHAAHAAGAAGWTWAEKGIDRNAESTHGSRVWSFGLDGSVAILKRLY